MQNKKEYHLPLFYPRWMKDAFNYFENDFSKRMTELKLFHPDIEDIVKLALFPGRRIRPSLFCAFWYSIKKAYPIYSEINPAIALELFHSASIIIDDILDKEELRRNKELLYRRIGRDRAILVSQLLISNGYEYLLTSYKSEQQISTWNVCYKKATIGELVDISKFNNLSIGDHCEKSLEKTISFFEFIAQSLLIYFPQIGSDLIKLFQILGRTFQISNDITDFFTLDISGRYSDGNSYVINHSAVIPILISKNIILEHTILENMPYEQLIFLLEKTKKTLGNSEEVLKPIVSESVTNISYLKLERSLLELGIEFLNTLINPDFWLHHHENN